MRGILLTQVRTGYGHDAVFIGDVLFRGGHGKTAALDKHHTLMDDLERKVRPAAGRHLGLPGAPQGHDTWRRAAYLPEWCARGW